MWRPIITAAYGQSGQQMPQGMPNMGDFGQGPTDGGDASGGPTIDEVD